MTSGSTLLRDARRRSGLTQAQVAERAGVSQSAIAQLEQVGSNPTIETLGDVLRATGERLRLTSEPDQPNVDETLIARNLRMTPAERLAAFETAHTQLTQLRAMAAATDAR